MVIPTLAARIDRNRLIAPGVPIDLGVLVGKPATTKGRTMKLRITIDIYTAADMSTVLDVAIEAARQIADDLENGHDCRTRCNDDAVAVEYAPKETA